MFRQSLGIIAAGLLCLIVVSCGPRAGQDVSQVIREAQQIAQQGKVDKALDWLNSFHKSRHYEKSRAVVFRAMLQMEVDAGRLDAAQARFKDMVKRQPAEAAQGVGVIEDYLAKNGRHEAVMAWCDSLKTAGLGDEVLLATVGRHIQAALALGRMGEVARIMGSYLPCVSEPSAIALVNRLVEEDVRNSQWDAAEQKIAALETSLKESPAKRGAAASLRLTLLLGLVGWNAGGTYLRGALK